MPLSLSPATQDPTTESALRAAFKQLRHVARRMTFEQAMAVPALAIGIRDLAEAIAKKSVP